MTTLEGLYQSVYSNGFGGQMNFVTIPFGNNTNPNYNNFFDSPILNNPYAPLGDAYISYITYPYCRPIQIPEQIENTKTKAQKFSDWTDAVARNSFYAEPLFKLKSDTTSNQEEYMKDLENISEEYINMYDSDKDGKIAFDEFLDFEIKNAESKIGNINDSDKEELKNKLMLIYSRLNVNDKGDSKSNLTKEEVMNMFITMDSSNGDGTYNGTISQYEYLSSAIALADSSKDSDSRGNKYSDKLKQNYKEYFQT